MTKLLITYNMQNEIEECETCIVLPMRNEIAKDILEKSWESSYLDGLGTDDTEGEIHCILRIVSNIQGYEYAGFCTAEEIKN